MYIQGWFPLGLTGLISLQPKGFSRVFSSTTIWKHQFFGTQPSLWYNSHICTWLLETIALKPGYSTSCLASLGLAVCCDSVIKTAFSVHSAHLFNSIPWGHEVKLQKSRNMDMRLHIEIPACNTKWLGPKRNLLLQWIRELLKAIWGSLWSLESQSRNMFLPPPHSTSGHSWKGQEWRLNPLSFLGIYNWYQKLQVAHCGTWNWVWTTQKRQRKAGCIEGRINEQEGDATGSREEGRIGGGAPLVVDAFSDTGCSPWGGPAHLLSWFLPDILHPPNKFTLFVWAASFHYLSPHPNPTKRKRQNRTNTGPICTGIVMSLDLMSMKSKHCIWGWKQHGKNCSSHQS